MRLYRALAWLLVAAATGCAEEPAPNLLLVTIDTLRSDRTSAYGFALDTTPNLRRLADEGLRFEAAYAPTATTAPSHATLFTGVPPTTHRVVKNGLALDASWPTLAERFAAEGHQTAAIVSSYVLKRKFGLGRGFEFYLDEFALDESADGAVDLWLGESVGGAFERRADATTNHAVAWLEAGRDPERPFFLFVHYFDPHSPYRAPEPFASAFLAETDAGPAREVRRRYDAEIAYVDHEFGRLLDALDALGLAEDTLVVVTSDHGEGLLDHGYLMHGPFVYEEDVRVPLLLRWPGEIPQGLRVTAPVGLDEVAPTVLSLAGLDATKLGGTPRPPLDAVARGEATLDASRAIFLYRRHYEPGWLERIRVSGEKFGIRRGRWKYIEGPAQGTRELYDLETDPNEKQNLYYDEPKPAAAIRERLDAWRAENTRAAPVPALDPEDGRRLEALGYVE